MRGKRRKLMIRRKTGRQRPTRYPLLWGYHPV